jgi:hypothetical protein
VADRLSRDLDRSVIQRVSAGDDFDESGFARSVFTEESMDLARNQIKRHPAQRADSSEGLGDGGELEERLQTTSVDWGR